MVKELLRLLGEEMQSEAHRIACPTPAQLAATSRCADSGIDVADLARHLPRCITCARRWDLLQTDACVGIGEALVMGRIKPDEFARTRAKSHALSCNKCAGILAALDRLGDLTAGIAGTNAIVLPVRVLAQARSVTEARVISAAVIDADGTPRIEAEQVVQHPSAILEATVSGGFLSIRLQAGAGFERAYLAIFSSGDGKDGGITVVFPPAAFVDGIASWRVSVTAKQGVMPADHLAAAFVARPII